MRTLASILIALALMGCSQKPEYREAPLTGDEINISTNTLKGETPVFFTLFYEGKRYDFFVHIVNGEAHAYADACFKCAPSKKGFEVSGNRLRCRACGESFPLSSLRGIGSCYPIPLEGTLKGELFVLDIDQLIRKTKYPL